MPCIQLFAAWNIICCFCQWIWCRFECLTICDKIYLLRQVNSLDTLLKPALQEKPQGIVGGSESEIIGSLERDFWTAIDHDRVPEFLVSRLRNRGHRLIARWGEEILLETSSNQRTRSSISGWEQWQWQRALESCQKWKLHTSLTGHVIFWNLGPPHLSTALLYIAQTMQKAASVEEKKCCLLESKWKIKYDLLRN